MKSALETAEFFTRLAWRDKDPDSLSKVMRNSTQIIDSRMGDLTGVASLQRTLKRWHRSFPDLRYTERDTTLNDDGSITKSWEVNATHLGPCYQIDATGKSVHYEGKTTFSLDSDNFIQRYHAHIDIGEILAQIVSEPLEQKSQSIGDFTDHFNRVLCQRFTEQQYTLIALSLTHLSLSDISDMMNRSMSGTKKAKLRIIEKMHLNNWTQVIYTIYACNLDSLLSRLGNEMFSTRIRNIRRNKIVRPFLL